MNQDQLPLIPQLDTGNRILSTIVELVLFGALGFGGFMVVAFLTVILVGVGAPVGAMQIALTVVMACAFLFINKDLVGGRSVSKRILGLVVVRAGTLEVAGPLRCAGRNVVGFVLFPIELLMCLVSPSRRVGDLIFGTELMAFGPQVKKSRKPLQTVWTAVITALALILPGIQVFYMEPIEETSTFKFDDLYHDGDDALLESMDQIEGSDFIPEYDSTYYEWSTSTSVSSILTKQLQVEAARADIYLFPEEDYRAEAYVVLNIDFIPEKDPKVIAFMEDFVEETIYRNIYTNFSGLVEFRYQKDGEPAVLRTSIARVESE